MEMNGAREKRRPAGRGETARRAAGPRDGKIRFLGGKTMYASERDPILQDGTRCYGEAMRCTPLSAPPADIPEIIQAVLIQGARLRTAGLITSRQLALQLKRLAAEELLPRGLSIELEKKAAGGARYILKAKDGAVRQTFDC